MNKNNNRGGWLVLTVVSFVVLVMMIIMNAQRLGAAEAAAAASACPPAGEGMVLVDPRTEQGKADRVYIDIPTGGGVLNCAYEFVEVSEG